MTFARDLIRKVCNFSGSCARSGFTLLEVLVALAVVAAVLTSIGYGIAVAVRGTRTIAQRVSLAGVSEALFAGLPGRNALSPGSQVGETSGYQWRIDIAPINAVSDPDQPPPVWVPMAVGIRMQAGDGTALRLVTVRLVKPVKRTDQ
jgi:general secretion pathway protein I